MQLTKEAILSALESVMEPDLKKDIVTLKLVKDIVTEGMKTSFTVMVNNPALHSKKRMKEACLFNLERAFGKEFEFDINIEGLPKDTERDAESRKMLPGVKNIIAISSGKGGVGKSTITANLAVGLAQKGYKVGLVDADIYGPSMPLMLDCFRERPTSIVVDDKKYIKPLENHGIKLISVGFFADPTQAVAWRGPMAVKALNQMFGDVYWGELDYLLIDLPPGTGDVHLSLVSKVPLTGAIVVSTPQDVALIDAQKGISMFKLENVNVPILGIIENMAYFTPAELPDNKYYIFGQDGAKRLAAGTGVPFLGEIPIVQSIREAGDVGRPAVMQENTVSSRAFNTVIDNLVDEMAKVHAKNSAELEASEGNS